MKRLNALAIFLLLLSSILAKADEGTIAFQKLKLLPKEVRRKLPPKAKTLIGGTFKVGRTTVLLHFYSFPKIRVSVGAPDFPSSGGMSDSFLPQPPFYNLFLRKHKLDFFVRRYKKYIRINTVPIDQYVDDQSTDGFLAPYIHLPFVWLNKKTRQTPVLQINVPTQPAWDGGNVWILVFAKGMNKTPLIQKFEYEKDNGFGNSTSVSLAEHDKKGFAVVYQWQSVRRESGYQWTHHWNGRGFVAE